MTGQEGQVRRLAEELCALTEEDWLLYIFAGDPLSGRLDRGQKLEHAGKAVACGRELAQQLLLAQGPLPMEERVRACGGRLVRPEPPSAGLLPLFAAFTEPDEISVYTGNAQATDALLQQEGLEELTGSVPTEEVLLAHELYHLLEHRDPSLYTRQKHLRLWKIGRWENRSSILCLSEMAAMAFAQAMTGLGCSVYVLDVLMLYVNNPQLALKKHQEIMDFVRR